MNLLNETSDNMKLRKRVLIIFLFLVIIFVTHIWYFYKNPNYGTLNVIDNQLKKPLSRSYGNARNLFQGYRMHKESLDLKAKFNATSTEKFKIDNYSQKTTQRTSTTSTSTVIINVQMVKRSAIFGNLEKLSNKDNFKKTNLVVPSTSNSPKLTTIINNRVKEYSTHNMQISRKKPVIKSSMTKGYGITQIPIPVNFNKVNNFSNSSRVTKSYKKVKTKKEMSVNFIQNKQSNLKLNVDKKAFALADENFIYDNLDISLPLKKRVKQENDVLVNTMKIHDNGNNIKNDIDLDKYDGNMRNDDHYNDQVDKSNNDFKASFEFGDIINIVDHRLTKVKNRNEMTKQEILFGDLHPKNITLLENEIKIVSMSLYGSEKKYLTGALKNAKLIKQNFPGWKLRIYVESHVSKSPHYGLVPQNVLDALQDLGADLHFIEPEEDFLPPMMWRFLVADDPSVDRFIIRDSDSRLTERDYKSVEAWMISGQPFHCVRDHPSHVGQSVSGGLWGGEAKKLQSILRSSWISAMRGLSTKYFIDMSFLQKHVWPKVVSHAYCSDSVSCDKWPNSFPFSVRRYGFDHVGQVYDERDVGRRVDVRILERRGENHLCTSLDEYDES